MKSVCIVGAGPAGLVSAKTFLQTEQFEVTVYEKNDRIGGIWALDRSTRGTFLSPYTPTNLSRFTVGFSDLDWNSINFHGTQANGFQHGENIHERPPMFPKAWMANRYLETYSEKYIPSGIIQCSREVVGVERVGSKWKITTEDEQSRQDSKEFDYLVMASGFFARPRLLEQDVPGLAKADSKPPVKIIHSSMFRELKDLFPDGTHISGKNILMLGGGNSSGETAAAVALQLSDSQWSPDTSLARQYKDCKIVHVTPRPLYPLPHFHEYEEGSRSYVPLDFKLYDFAKRPTEMESYAGRQTKQVRDFVHGRIQAMVGGDQSDISEALVSRKGDGRGSAYVALSESYSEYVRSGLIEVVSGRVTTLEEGTEGCAIACVEQNGESNTLDGIAAVIYATGYTPRPSLTMLDEPTKTGIQYDSESMRLPMILEQWQSMSRDADSISFIGFYEGPYWPMLEMQARLTTERWLSGKVAPTRTYEHKDQLLELRESMKDRGLDVPQYWLSDHLGYMEDIASELGLERNNQGFADREGLPSPARYLSPKTNTHEADAIMQDLRKVWHNCTVNGKYVPRAAFRALHGHWNIKRRIESVVPTFPSGTLEGEASFYPRVPTSDASGRVFDLEYLYIEAGTFTTSTGYSMKASRRYVYRYFEAEDELSVWFVKPDKNLEVDYLFHNLQFVQPAEARPAGASVAKADHLCVKDMYWTQYRLPLTGVALREFEVKHTVKGPEKDYVATAEYTRPAK